MSRKTILATCLIFVLAAFLNTCWAQSFRSYATGDLLYGDFDNDTDPIYIWENDGYRIYSTLSNLSTTSDKFISNINNGVYLFGISGNFGLPEVKDWQSRTMFYVELSDTRFDNDSGLDTDFDGAIDEPGEGYMSGDRVQLFDNNSDNVYDTRTNISSTADNFNIMKMRDWELIHSYELGDTRLGLKLSHQGYGYNYWESNVQRGLFSFVAPSHNFSYSNDLVSTDLNTTDVLETRRESGDFKATNQTPANIIKLGLEAPFNSIANSKIRFDVSLAMLKNKYEVDDRYRFFRDLSTPTIVNINSNGETVMVDSSLGGYVITPAVRLTKNWSATTYSWFDFAYGFGSFDADKTFLDIFNAEIQLTGGGGNTAITTRDYNDTVDQTGDTKRKEMAIFHKTVVEFTDNFTFSAGFDYSYISDKTDWDADYATSNNGSYDNGDGVDDLSDSSYTIVSSLSANLVAKAKTRNIYLPVAMEYSLGRWTFRLGAVHLMQKRVEEEDFQVRESAATVTTIAYGNDSTSVVISDDDYLSLGGSRESKSSSTNFVYGLELNASDNLKLEIIQFMETANVEIWNTNFYRQLRMSLTVLF